MKLDSLLRCVLCKTFEGRSAHLAWLGEGCTARSARSRNRELASTVSCSARRKQKHNILSKGKGRRIAYSVWFWSTRDKTCKGVNFFIALAIVRLGFETLKFAFYPRVKAIQTS